MSDTGKASASGTSPLAKKIANFNEAILLFKGYLESQELKAEIPYIVTDSDLRGFCEETDPELLATKDPVLFNSHSTLFGLDILFTGPTLADPESETFNEEQFDKIWSFIEDMYKISCSKKRYNQYVNKKFIAEDAAEKKQKKRANAHMRKMIPLIKQIIDNIDKGALKELFELIKTPLMAKNAKKIFEKLMTNNFDMEKSFEDFDLEAFGIGKEEADSLVNLAPKDA